MTLHSNTVACLVLLRQVGTNLVTPDGARTINATGKLVIPGQCHINPSITDFAERQLVFCNGVNEVILNLMNLL